MKMILNIRKLWYEVRKYQDELLKNVSWQYNQRKRYSEVIKFSLNDGTIFIDFDFDPFFGQKPM